MKAIVVKKIGEFAYQECPAPTPLAGELLIRVHVTGLCRTDLKIIERGHRDLLLPRIPGEEVVGTVIGRGEGVAPDWIGKRVYLYPGISCGHCRPCLRGAGNLCTHMRIMGFHRDGGFAEQVTCPAQSAILLPDGLDFETAVLAEPLSCCLNGIEQAHPLEGDRALVFGAGPAGTLLARALRASGCTVDIVEPDPRRRLWARGCEHPPSPPYDIIIPAVGDAQIHDRAAGLLAPRGRLVLFSGLASEESHRSLDVNELHYLEQTLVGAYGCSYRHSLQAIDWLHRQVVRVDDMISHRLPLSALAEALDLVRTRAGMKILLSPSPNI